MKPRSAEECRDALEFCFINTSSDPDDGTVYDDDLDTLIPGASGPGTRRYELTFGLTVLFVSTVLLNALGELTLRVLGELAVGFIGVRLLPAEPIKAFTAEERLSGELL